MYLLTLITTLLPFLGATTASVTVPNGIEKISNQIVRNGSYYYRVYPKLNTGMKSMYIGNSSDMISWQNNFHVFSDAAYPAWSTNEEYLNPDLNVIGQKMVRLYFDSVRKSSGGYLGIGVAFAETFDHGPT